jgi:hypothetical protein
MEYEMGRACSMNEGEMDIGIWWECQKKRDQYEDQDVDGWTILKWILKIHRMGWYGLR